MRYKMIKGFLIFLLFSCFIPAAYSDDSISCHEGNFRDFIFGSHKMEELFKQKKRCILTGAVLNNYDFRGADFRRAILMDADLRGSDFSGADFTDSDISNADFSWLETNEGIVRTKLLGASFINLDCRKADFRWVDAGGIYLYGVGCKGADFRHADLPGASINNGDFRGADFRHSNLRGARIFSSIASGDVPNFKGADFREADLRDVINDVNSRAKFEGSDFRGTDLRGFSFGVRVEFAGAKYDDTTQFSKHFTPAIKNIMLKYDEEKEVLPFPAEERKPAVPIKDTDTVDEWMG